MSKPIVWTIAGSDSGGGAGIQADLHTFQAFGVHGCSVIAALTAQNSRAVSRVEFVSNEMIHAQIEALEQDLPAKAIKMGMLGSLATMQAIIPLLNRFHGALIYDPVLFATVGDALYEGDIRQFLLTEFIPLMTLITPNIPEAEWLLAKSINSNEEMALAAHELLTLGAQNVFIKGGHAKGQNQYCQDYFASANQQFWLNSPRQNTRNTHGTGCTLSSAITACLALGYSLLDALVLAKAYVNQGLRSARQLGTGPGPVAHGNPPEKEDDFPFISTLAEKAALETAFQPCEELGFYPIVSSVDWVKKLLIHGVKAIQLRIKDSSAEKLQANYEECIQLARHYNAALIINDHWELAIELGAYGVHLGQDDLETADIRKIQNAGLRLGISTHSYSEIARALALKPSYIAIGPIFATSTKEIPFKPQGLKQLTRFCQLLTYPVVAIGGIQFNHLPSVWKTGVRGVAIISALLTATDPDKEIQRWLDFFLNQRPNQGTGTQT